MKFVASMTTSPKRLPLIDVTLQSLLGQTFPISKIILNIPPVFQRTGETYNVPAWLTDMTQRRFFSRLEINRECEDLGPITKLYPTVMSTGDDEDLWIVCVDDDMNYMPHMLEVLADYVQKNPVLKAVGYTGCFVEPDDSITMHGPLCIHPAHYLEGFMMCCYHRSCFIKEDFHDYCQKASSASEPRACDDITIGNYLFKRKVQPWVVSTSKMNANMFHRKQCSLPHGFGEDALHKGADGHVPLMKSNERRYAYALSWLKANDMYYFTPQMDPSWLS